jgi:hypothetical protein
MINPDIVESLDGIDNNCRDGIDEDFIGTDADSDGLLDLVEFHNTSTDPFNPDSDEDGLSDGMEVNETLTDPNDNDSDDDGLSDGMEVHETLTNPLVPDLDGDGDGFRWFQECDDNNSAVHPNATEEWNGIDDDCDEDVDEDISRLEHIQSSPENTEIMLNATFDNLELLIEVNLTQSQLENLNLSITWYRNGTLIHNGSSFEEAPWSCDDNQTLELGLILCNHTGVIGPWILSASISDGQQDIFITWYVTYDVWHPPIPEPEEEISDDGTSIFEFIGKNLLLLVIGVIILILAIILLMQKRKPPEPIQVPHVNSKYQQRWDTNYQSVPGAPILPPL